MISNVETGKAAALTAHGGVLLASTDTERPFFSLSKIDRTKIGKGVSHMKT